MNGPIKMASSVGFAVCFAGMLLAQTLDARTPGKSTTLWTAVEAYLTGVHANRGEKTPSPAAASMRNLGGGSVTLEPDANGHYRADVDVYGHRIRMLVDTGATIVALTREDADALGVRPMPSDFTVQLSTANGGIKAAATYLPEVRVGTIVAQNVPAVVMPQGVMNESLLGMSFLRKLGGFEVAYGKLILKP